MFSSDKKPRKISWMWREQRSIFASRIEEREKGQRFAFWRRAVVELQLIKQLSLGGGARRQYGKDIHFGATTNMILVERT
jgi:hypothetical protein